MRGWAASNLESSKRSPSSNEAPKATIDRVSPRAVARCRLEVSGPLVN
jgi:hypothetical protein